MPRARQNLRKLTTVHAASNGVITHKVYKSPTSIPPAVVAYMAPSHSLSSKGL